MRDRIQEFLREDIGTGDITSDLVVPENVMARGRIICKEDCVLAGMEEASVVFKELGAKATKVAEDGKPAKVGDTVLEVVGTAKSILAGERLALNFVMRMSGIATLTHVLVEKCRVVNPNIRVAATRKTTPGFREFEKRAVLLGGGDPHRAGLYDAVLIKDNHIRMVGGIEEALKRARTGSFTRKIEVEAENPDEARIAARAGADIIMLDNFELEQVAVVAEELRGINPDVLIEASGGIWPDNIQEYAVGADIVSLGWLTHSVKSIDFSMDLEKI